jgi:1-phosphofructokinase
MKPRICVFSPAPLLTVTIEPAIDGREELHLHPGGQGFWVARTAVVLGAEVMVCAPFGGETGDVLQYLIGKIGIRLRAIPTQDATGAYVHDRRSGERHEIWQSTLDVLGRHELDELYTATLAEGIAAGVCVLAGSQLEEIVDPDTYHRLASDLASNGTHVVADLCGPLLKSALEGGLDLLKVSHTELLDDGWTSKNTRDGILAGIEMLRKAGARNVVVSRAEEGSIAHLDGKLFEIKAPPMKVVDSRGAGDAMTAALAVATAKGLDAEETLRLAAGAAALNVTRHGLGSGHADAIAQLAANVDVTRLDEKKGR